MTEIINQSELLVLFRLLAAHMISEWAFRMRFWNNSHSGKKWFSKRQLLQGVLAGILSYIFVGYWGAFWLPLIIFISRIGINGWNLKDENTILPLILKQMGHLVVISGCWAVLVSLSIGDIIVFLNAITSNTGLWIVSLSYITVIWPAGIWIGKITEPWRRELKKPEFQGLEKAGLWLGRLERILILTFVLLDHYDAIGFLIAAKSIFRFSEIKSSKDRKEAEYILIGTMLSFVIAIFMGIFVTWFLKQLRI
ncbi:MAG: DUF3307 domain-containing protein [bacterium]|nr:DUF3307 domain-containing protein [bacterium]